MARPESQAVAGYYPTPEHLLPAIASLLDLDPDNYTPTLLDPCAGDGQAIATLDELLTSSRSQVWAVELEATRHEDLRRRFATAYRRRELHADAFSIELPKPDSRAGATLLYLNPPYDTDRQHGRLEQRFLDRFRSFVAPGGLLCFVVPVYALEASIPTLATHFEHIAIHRFPDPDYAVYHQVVLTARRRAPMHDPPLAAALQRSVADPAALPVLAVRTTPLLRSLAADRAELYLVDRGLDLSPALEAFKPWAHNDLVGTQRSVENLFSTLLPTALPPRPAHLALALSVGVLNGQPLRPNPDASHLPTILLKSRFNAEWVTTEQRFNKDGDLTGEVQIQRPRLTTNILRLDDLTFHCLQPGTAPSGATDLAAFNTADIIQAYDRDLSAIVKRAFPTLHDPANDAHLIELPPLKRSLFDRQSHLVQAALKLLARGDNPQIVAEMGTGKTTVALTIAYALSPAHVAATRAQLTRLGLPAERLRPVRRVLVVCPPHLPKNWSDQAKAVLPNPRIVTINSFSDCERDADVFILSRETAKLGSGVGGLLPGRAASGASYFNAPPARSKRPVCPACGNAVTTSPEVLATQRACCEASVLAPRNETARLLVTLALLLYKSAPDDAFLRRLLRNHPRLLAHRPEPTSLDLESLRHIRDACLQARAEDDSLPLIALFLTAVLGDGEAVAEVHFPALAPDAGRHRYTRTRLAQAAVPDYQSDVLAWLLERLSALANDGSAVFSEEPCGEPLYSSLPTPRRYPLARHILKAHPGKFDLLMLDEAHEFNGEGSAQAKAAHRLTQLPGVPTLMLTGSLTAGYASDLFGNQWALCRPFRGRFALDERTAFVQAYGYRKRFLPAGDNDNRQTSYGTNSDRELAPRSLGEAPGVHPAFILRHLLPTTLLMHLADLEHELPPRQDIPVPIEFAVNDPHAQALKKEFTRLLTRLVDQINSDRRDDRLRGRLWGQFARLPTYLDLCHAESGAFEIAYPEQLGGAILTTAQMFPSEWISPKERWLIKTIRACIQAREKVILYIHQTGSAGWIKRLLRIIRENALTTPVFLDAKKVPSIHREDWIDANVLASNRRVLIVNPEAVKTGLNNLVSFQHTIWLQGPSFRTETVRQANARIRRIGQVGPVEFHYPYYYQTVQQTGLNLVAAKISAAERVEALSLESALEAAGAASEDETSHTLAAMAIGRALFDAWQSAA